MHRRRRGDRDGGGADVLIRAALLRLLVAAWLCLALPPLAAAQSLPGLKPANASAPAAPRADDPFGRDTPRGLANGLIAALAAQDYERAANYFDLAHVRASTRASYGAAAAKHLQDALDAGGSLLPNIALSDDPAGKDDDGLPPDQERLGALPTSHGGTVPLTATAGTGPNGPVWRISATSLAALADLPAAPERDSLRDRLPSVLTDTMLWGAPLSDWLILLVTAAVFYALVRLVFTLALWLIGRWKPDHENSRAWRLIHAASSPVSLWLAQVLFLQATRSAHIAIVARQIVGRFVGAGLLLALAWFAWRLIDVIADFWGARMARTERHRARSILIFARRTGKIVLFVLAGIWTLDALGINVTTGIAALGLGGLAIALGAQKTVENIVGSVSVIADEPVRVGDFCRVGDVVGTVEDIGIRSTRIRTNERTRVTIPNGNFAALQIENYSLRDRYLFRPTLKLAADTDADGVERALAAIRAVLAEADCLYPDPRATLVNLGDWSIDVELFGWIDVPDFAQSLYLREKLLLELMRRVAAAGVAFALPTRTVQVAAAPGVVEAPRPPDAPGDAPA